MKLPKYYIWCDAAIGNAFAVVIVAVLTKPQPVTAAVKLTILETRLIKIRNVAKEERIKRMDEEIKSLKIKYDITNESLQEISSL